MYFNLDGPKLVVLAGPTGSGKTAVLEALSSKGFSIINLEDLARHRGSVFGALGTTAPQPSQPDFERVLLTAFEAQASAQMIFTEQEAPSIGKRRIPEWFFEKMQTGLFVCLHLPRKERVRLITEEYGQFDSSDLCSAIDKLSQRLGAEQCQSLKALVLDNRFPEFADLMLDYYDRSFHYSLTGKDIALEIRVERFQAEQVASQLVEEITSRFSVSPGWSL